MDWVNSISTLLASLTGLVLAVNQTIATLQKRSSKSSQRERKANRRRR